MIIGLGDLESIRSRYQDKKIILGGGMFDLLHIGHINYLKYLRDRGDVTVVLVKGDARYRIYKRPDGPITPQAERAAIVDAVKYVDYTLTTTSVIEGLYEKIFKKLRPDALVVTNQFWSYLQGKEGVVVEIVKPFGRKHTSEIIKQIREPIA